MAVAASIGMSSSVGVATVISGSNLGDRAAGGIKSVMSTLSQSPTATTSKADLELRKIIDAGVLRFNNSAKDGIKYLVSAGVLDDDPAEIAEFLAKQENLDKHVIGEYLGKDNEFNIAVLNRFAQLFDYRDLPADEALRLFMCRFAMPGEAQQVYRILERFSTYYAATCSSLNRDQVHILAYALIMLNVDAHNPLVTDKMTRDQFINNTMPEVSPGCTAEELGQMYDRIVAKEFRPDTTPQELMYVRLAKNPQYSADEKNVAASAEDIHRMKKGDNFLKFGRRGRPHPRRVFLSEDESRICWMEPTESRGGRLGSLLNHDAAVPRGRAVVTGGRPATAPPASEVSNGGTGGRSPDATSELMVSGKAMPIAGAGDLATTGVSATHSLRNIRLDEVTGLCVGTSGSSVFRKQWVPETVEDRCFSIITEKRSLDLQAPPGVDMRMWLRFFHYVLSEREAKIRASADPVKEALEMQRAGAKRLRRWKEEILPNWAKHWTTGAQAGSGTQSRNPEGFRSRGLRMLENATHRIIVSDRQPNEALTFQMFYSGGFALDRGQRLETARTPTLVNLWLEGLPPALRCKIWPIAIGNNLRITSDTFSTLTRKVHRAERRNSWSQSQRTYLARFKNDLESDLAQAFIGKVVQWLHTFATREQLEGFLDVATENGYRRMRAHESIMDDQRMMRSKSSGSDDDEEEDRIRYCECDSDEDLDGHGGRPSRGCDECGVAVEAIPSPAHGLATPNTIRSRAPSDSIGGPSTVHPQTDAATSVGSHSRFGDSTVICERCRKLAISKKLSTKRTWSEPWENAWIGGGRADTSGEDAMIRKGLLILLSDLIKAFIVYRSDVGYVPGMISLCATVLVNVGPHPVGQVFCTLANLMHQYYFLDVYMVKRRNMKMRFDFLEVLLRERAPFLEKHFSILQLTPEVYFLPWLTSVFTRCMPFHAVCRMWDGFLLLGEAHVFTCALALLWYHEHALMTSGFGGCLEILTSPPDERLFDENKFFDYYMKLPETVVPNERLGAWMAAQRLGEEKTSLFELLFS